MTVDLGQLDSRTITRNHVFTSVRKNGEEGEKTSSVSYFMPFLEPLNVLLGDFLWLHIDHTARNYCSMAT
jgi:hypothetical protein